jgi:hypothetical protein
MDHDMIRFLAELADGRRFLEGPGVTWDDVPLDSPIASLELVDGLEHLATLQGFSRFFFSNEAVSAISDDGRGGATTREPVLVAKILGGISADGKVSELRVELRPGGPVAIPREYPIQGFQFVDAAVRKGA